MASGRPVTNDRLYEALQSVRLELKADIRGVDDKVNRVITAQAVDKTKIGALVSGLSIVISATVTVILENLKRGIT